MERLEPSRWAALVYRQTWTAQVGQQSSRLEEVLTGLRLELRAV